MLVAVDRTLVGVPEAKEYTGNRRSFICAYTAVALRSLNKDTKIRVARGREIFAQRGVYEITFLVHRRHSIKNSLPRCRV